MALVSVSDDKIQITILILRRGALSTSEGKGSDFGIFVSCADVELV